MPHPHIYPSTVPVHCERRQAPSGYYYKRRGDKCELRKRNNFGHVRHSKFGMIPIECNEFGYGSVGCMANVPYGYGSVYIPTAPPFGGYGGGYNNPVIGGGNGDNGNTNQTVVVTTPQINTMLQTIKQIPSANVSGSSVIQMDIFTQIKNLIAQHPLLTMGGAGLLVYLVAKK